MKIFRSCLATICCLALSSCYYERKAYYMSPADLRSTPYVTIPMHADPEKTITAVSIAVNPGLANQRSRDNLIAGSGSVMQSHQFGFFQAYYGAVLSMGDYLNKSTDLPGAYSDSLFTDTGGYHIPGINKFYGYYGLNGGINVVVPFANGKGEWRALGVDFAYRKEFGDYLKFRRGLKADEIDILATYGHTFTIGGSTEIVGRNSRGVQFGYRIAAGAVLYPSGTYNSPGQLQKPFYFTQTFQVTKNRVTGFMQLALGTYAQSFTTGVNISLRKRKTDFLLPEQKPRPVRGEQRPDRPRRLRPFEKRRTDSGEHD